MDGGADLKRTTVPAPSDPNSGDKVDRSPVVSEEVVCTTCYMCACRCGIRVHVKGGRVLALCGLLAPLGVLPREPGFGLTALGLAFLLVTAGLLASTAMIYALLKPIHQWCNAHVAPVYLALALMTGALWLNALLQLWNKPSAVVATLAAFAIPLAWLKERYWRFVDTTPSAATPESATGLMGRGKVTALDRPHTGENYLLREMGFVVARKHALKLRRIALGAGFVVPLVLTLLAALVPGPVVTLAAILALAAAMTGVLAERWLFFAEARHTVSLYYGALEA